MAASVDDEQLVTKVIAGHSTLHMAAPNGQWGSVIFKTTSNGMQSNATVRSDTARFTRRKFRVVRMRGVPKITKQTRMLPTTLTRNTITKMVYSTIWSQVIPNSGLLNVEWLLIWKSSEIFGLKTMFWSKYSRVRSFTGSNTSPKFVFVNVHLLKTCKKAKEQLSVIYKHISESMKLQFFSDSFLSYINCISLWIQENKLFLNMNKTEYVIYGSHQRLKREDSISLSYNGSFLTKSESFKYLSVVIDRHLSFNKHASTWSIRSRGNWVLLGVW